MPSQSVPHTQLGQVVVHCWMAHKWVTGVQPTLYTCCINGHGRGTKDACSCRMYHLPDSIIEHTSPSWYSELHTAWQMPLMSVWPHWFLIPQAQLPMYARTKANEVPSLTMLCWKGSFCGGVGRAEGGHGAGVGFLCGEREGEIPKMCSRW